MSVYTPNFVYVPIPCSYNNINRKLTLPYLHVISVGMAKITYFLWTGIHNQSMSLITHLIVTNML